MNAAKLSELIGQPKLMMVPNGLKFAVVILDARSVFGRIDVQVRPVEGSGKAWVSLDTVQDHR